MLYLKILLLLSRYLFIARYRLRKVAFLYNLLDELVTYLQRYAFNFSIRLKPFAIEIENVDVEIHTLLTSRDVSMYLWAIRSLLYYSEIKCPVVVHDDGKLTAEDYATLQESLPGIKIISRQEADPLIELKLKEFPKCLEYRQQNILTLKMFDFNLLSKAKKILSFDSDILFFRQPAEIIQNINSCSSEIIYNREFNNPVYSINATITESFPSVLPGFNSGLMCYVREDFHLAEIAEMVDWVYLHQDHLDRLDEQVIYAILAERKLSRPLSSQYCADLQPKVRENKFVCRHYHTCLRHAFALEGLKELLRLKPKFLM
jgi:hypothetical protein